MSISLEIVILDTPLFLALVPGILFIDVLRRAKFLWCASCHLGRFSLNLGLFIRTIDTVLHTESTLQLLAQ